MITDVINKQSTPFELPKAQKETRHEIFKCPRLLSNITCFEVGGRLLVKTATNHYFNGQKNMLVVTGSSRVQVQEVIRNHIRII